MKLFNYFIISCFILLFFAKCNTDYNSENSVGSNNEIYSELENEGDASLTKEQLEDLKQMKIKVRVLYKKLLNFKDKRDFHQFGFGTGHKYNAWLIEVNQLSKEPINSILLARDGFVVGELSSLAMEYMRNNGNETDFSRYTKENILNGLNND